MEYHEIGERFEYDGVMLEVVKRDNCEDCFFNNRTVCTSKPPMRCTSEWRNDKTSIIYKLVEQCKTKDMEQKTKIKVEGKDEAFASATEPVTGGKGTGDVCKAGETFVCVSDVIDGDNVTRFTKGKIYVCGTDNVLRNDNGTEEDWSGCVGFTDAFVRLDDGFHTCFDHAEIPKKERVNHPDYYNRHPSGVECITIIRHHNFNIGSVIKYCWRNGLKTEEGMSDKDKQIEDLKKAIFYLNDEIKRLEEF